MFAYAKTEQKQAVKSPVKKKEPEKTPSVPNQTGMPLVSSVKQSKIDNALKSAKKDSINDKLKIFLGGGVSYGQDYDSYG